MTGAALPLQDEVVGVYALCFTFTDSVTTGVGCLPCIASGKNEGIKTVFEFRPTSPSPEASEDPNPLVLGPETLQPCSAWHRGGRKSPSAPYGAGDLLIWQRQRLSEESPDLGRAGLLLVLPTQVVFSPLAKPRSIVMLPLGPWPNGTGKGLSPPCSWLGTRFLSSLPGSGIPQPWMAGKAAVWALAGNLHCCIMHGQKTQE